MARGYVSLKPDSGGSVSIGLFDSPEKDKIVMTIRDDNEHHDFGVVVLEEWEAQAVIGALSLMVSRVQRVKQEFNSVSLMKDAGRPQK